MERGGQRSKTTGRKFAVLAVDDDALILMHTAAMLEEIGFVAFEAMSGRQALEILRREKAIDVVITDQAMPHMTGDQLAAAIRAEWPNLPILLASGYDEPGDPGLKLPKLGKPFRQEELARAIADAIHSGHQVSAG
ncbi:MAG: response regulator [Nitrospirota bacterium]|nr:response regulator [Nitrospirota bacterium]